MPFVAYVGPEPYLISGTVRENLLYGHQSKDQVTDADLWQALGLAQLESEIRSLPGSLDAKLNEQTQMSTGQKQRLAIARALLRKPQMLILDEATANLDGQTEDRFIQCLRPLLPRLTTVIISHKGSFNALATSTIILGE